VVVPPFIGEIASQRVRGAAGAAFQLSLTIGILIAQVIGMPHIAGYCSGWGWGLAIVFVLPFAGVFVLFLLPNSPTQMIAKYNDEDQATADLRKLRGIQDVHADLDIIREQTRLQSNGKQSEALSIIQVSENSELMRQSLYYRRYSLCHAIVGQRWSLSLFNFRKLFPELMPYFSTHRRCLQKRAFDLT